MRFIRKGGRIIPIRDSNDSRAKLKAQANAGARTATAGIGVGLAGAATLTARDVAQGMSRKFGQQAVYSAALAKAASRAGHTVTFGKYKAAAIGAAQASLKHGKIANVAQKIGRAGLGAGLGLYVAGATMLVGAGAAAAKLKKRK